MSNLLPSGALTDPTKTLISLLTTDGNIVLSLEDIGNNTGNALKQNSDFMLAILWLFLQQLSVNSAS